MTQSVDCGSKVEADYVTGGKPGPLHATKVRDWLDGIPDGAILERITWDFGNQRDPDERLTGLRASWSEVR